MPEQAPGRIVPSRGYRGKRALDLVIAVPAFVLALPLLGCLWCAVRVLLGSPVLFRQRRPGLHSGPFEILKLRTMTDARAADGSLLPDGLRLTRFGRVLRKTSLDELPELWNVVRGEMSLVGPRPLLMEYLPHYTDRERLRHEVRPGITGLAQVTGRNTIGWAERLELDATYVERMSLTLDLRILGRTVAAVLGLEGVAVNTDEVETRLDEERVAARGAGSTEVSDALGGSSER